MSFYTMAKQLTGEIPGTALSLVQTYINDALGEIYDETDWSFQKVYSAWLCPGQVANSGTFTVTPYLNTVIADDVATAAIMSIIPPPFITQLQYRDPERAPYNIVAQGTASTVAGLNIVTEGSGQTPGTYLVNGVGGSGSGAQALITVNANGAVTEAPVIISSGSSYVTPPSFTLSAGGTPATFAAYLNIVLTLDRIWQEPTSGPGQPYMIYQCYFVAPVQDFRKFVEVRDTTNAGFLDFWSKTQAMLAVEDPQRTTFSDPQYVVPYGVDQRPGSATLGWQMFELWPQQLSYVPYSFSYLRRGAMLVNPTDTVPYPLTEDLVRWKAKENLCLFKEAQKDKTEARGAGANWTLLSQLAQKKYEKEYDKIIAVDLNLRGDALTTINRGQWSTNQSAFANREGQLNIGGYGGGE